MKSVPVQEAVGMVLCHDITRIVPDEFKGRAFKKGQVIEPEDIPVLLDLGKAHVYIYDLADGLIHENDAARRISKAAAGPGIGFSDVSEGRVNLLADADGLLKIDVDALNEINSIDQIVFSTLHTNQTVRAKKALGGTRIVPLVTEVERIEAVERICREHYPVVAVKPFLDHKVGIVTTGSEVYSGRVEDKFGPVLHVKFAELGSTMMRQEFVSDSVEMTVKAIHGMLDDGAELIAVTGGMSVDPDDQTPASIRAAGGRVITYGSPIFPGAMFMLAYIGDVPVVGLPGCVMYYKSSVFDLVVPRLLAGDTVTRADIVAMGHGGFCQGCAECRYPLCPFGKSA